jgi:exodeoxyribonuclease VII small subunit
MRNGTEQTLEEALSRLEGIVEALEAGNMSLEESLKLFEEGTGLIRVCSSRLENAERRIEMLCGDVPDDLR